MCSLFNVSVLLFDTVTVYSRHCKACETNCTLILPITCEAHHQLFNTASVLDRVGFGLWVFSIHVIWPNIMIV